MAIDIKQPIVIPAKPEMLADKVWIISMNVTAKTAEKASASFIVAPFVSSTGEILYNEKKTITIDDVFLTCATNPTLAMSIGAIFQAVDFLCKQNRLFGMEPDPIVPNITSNISLEEVRCIGDVLSLNIETTGTSIVYQWKKDGIDLIDDGRIVGSNASNLLISNLNFDDVGQYHIVVSNKLKTISSNLCSVSVVIPPPSLTSYSTNLDLFEGENATFSVNVLPFCEPVKCQWSKDGKDLTDNERIFGSQSPDFTIQSITEDDVGEYVITVTNESGNIQQNFILNINN